MTFTPEFLDELRGRAPLAEAIGRRVQLKKRGREYLGLCPFHNEKTPSFTVNEDKGFYHCFGCGAHGDVIGFIMHMDNLSFAQAVARLLESHQPSAVSRQPLAKQDRATKAAAARAEENQNRERALRLWRGASERLRETPAAAYLAGRGIDLASLKDSQGCSRQPRALRFHGNCWNRESGKFWPALLAAVLDPAGGFAAVHRTWLAIDSRQPSAVSKAPLEEPKMTLGRYAGGAIRLWQGASGRPLEQAGPGETVALTEGIEDGLTVAIAKPELRVLAAVHLGNMKNVVLPGAVERVLICADNDGANKGAKKGLARAVEAFTGQGRKVLIARPPDGTHDFNDLLTGVEAEVSA